MVKYEGGEVIVVASALFWTLFANFVEFCHQGRCGHGWI